MEQAGEQGRCRPLDAVFVFDHLYIGGGNVAKVRGELGPKVTIIDPNAGLLGGIRLWQQNFMVH